MKPAHRKLIRFFSFAVMIAVSMVILKVANWLPLAVRSDGMRQYGSIEEVRQKLKIRDIYIPSYFPQSFSWPPSAILAQGRPFAAIVMEFRHLEKGDVALVISQAASADFRADWKIKLTQVRETLPYTLKGKNSVLTVGTCREGEPCSRISWDEGRYRMDIIAKYTPIELVRIAESMAH